MYLPSLVACAATGACIPVWSIVKKQNFLLREECKTAVSSIVLCAQIILVGVRNNLVVDFQAGFFGKLFCVRSVPIVSCSGAIILLLSRLRLKLRCLHLKLNLEWRLL